MHTLAILTAATLLVTLAYSRQVANFNYTSQLELQDNLMQGLSILEQDCNNVIKALTKLTTNNYPNYNKNTSVFLTVKLIGKLRATLYNLLYNRTLNFYNIPCNYQEFAIGKLLIQVVLFCLKKRAIKKYKPIIKDTQRVKIKTYYRDNTSKSKSKSTNTRLQKCC